jgi:GDP-D-mannose 3',5'-epimerase
MKKALVCGAWGFVGSHLVKRLKREQFWVRGVRGPIIDFFITNGTNCYIKSLNRAFFCTAKQAFGDARARV